MFELLLKGIWLETFSDLQELDNEEEVFCRQQYRDIPAEQELIFD